MKSEQHIPDCDSWLVRPPAWLCSVSTRNIWKFCLSVLRFPSFISDWLICFPHSESTNIEQQEITINGCLGPSAVHCSIWMHMRATPLTNTEFLHINTLCSHTHTHSPIGPSASSKSCQCPRITSSWSPLFLWSSDHWAENHLQGKKTSKHPTKSSDWKKKRWKYPKKRALRCWKMSFNKRLWRRKREKCFVGVSRGVFFFTALISEKGDGEWWKKMSLDRFLPGGLRRYRLSQRDEILLSESQLSMWPLKPICAVFI